MDKRGKVLTWVLIVAVVVIVAFFLFSTGFVQLSPGGGLVSYSDVCVDDLKALSAGYSDKPTDETINVISKCNIDVENYARVIWGANDGSCTKYIGSEFNGDLTVDQADLVEFLNIWKNSLTSSEGDINGDGITDARDMEALLGDFGPLSPC